MSTELVPGKYQFIKSENLEKFMRGLGVGYIVRKLANQCRPLVTISQYGNDVWTMETESVIVTTEIKFEMGQQFEEITADGRKVMSTLTVTAPNTVHHEMLGTGGGKDSFCTREFTEEKMKCVCNVGDIVTTAWYMRV